MIAYTTFKKLLHLSRSGYLLQSMHNGQRNYPYEVSTSAMLIFSKCVYLINVAKCKCDPNETIVMHDLSSSLQSFLVDCNTKQENLFCKFNKVIITISVITESR